MNSIEHFFKNEFRICPPITHTRHYLKKVIFKAQKSVAARVGFSKLLKLAGQWLEEVYEENPAAKLSLVRQRRLAYVLRKDGGGDDQRTEEWFLKRSRAITGSMVYQVMNTPAARYAAMVRKLRPEPKSNDLRDAPASCRHGIIFEDIARDIYCHWNDVEVKNLGCINHRVYPWLAASPDGYVEITKEVGVEGRRAVHGRLIEIKCPSSRVPKENYIPPDYYAQMQLQLECVKLDECDYIEFVFNSSIGTLSDFESIVVDGSDILAKGYVVFSGDMSSKQSWKIYYPGETVDLSEVHSVFADENSHIQYWSLLKYQNQLVKLEPDWLEKNLATFHAFWEELETHRKNGTMPEPPKDVKRRAAAKKDVLDFTTECLGIIEEDMYPQKKRKPTQFSCPM
jgi:putative phage-type endonuclease